MSSKSVHALRRFMIGLLSMAVAVVTSAQVHHEQASLPKDPGDVVLSADLVKTGLYLITGGGGNSLLRLSAAGSILVDGKLPGAYRPLMSQVRRISKLSDLPVKVLIVTDHHVNHIGNAAQFAAAGVPILAQANAKAYLPASESAGEKPHAPTITYDREYKFPLGGVEVQLFHFGNAHSNSDTVVYFPDLKVIAVGDLFTPDTPAADFAEGGSLVNWGPVLAEVLKLNFGVVVPSGGPIVARADLEAFKTKIDTLVSRATELVKKGVPKNELMAKLKMDDLGWRLSFTDDQLDRFYAELSRTK